VILLARWEDEVRVGAKGNVRSLIRLTPKRSERRRTILTPYGSYRLEAGRSLNLGLFKCLSEASCLRRQPSENSGAASEVAWSEAER
jgi:hypothetical protein